MVLQGLYLQIFNVNWRFAIKNAEPDYQKIRFRCEDYYNQFIEGDYPNTELVKDIFPSNDLNIGKEVYVPIPFGTCYIPLRSVYKTDQRYYLLGPTTVAATA